MRAVDALPAIRSSRFDLPLTYGAGSLELAVGDVVRIPLGGRDVLGFIISPVREADDSPPSLKAVRERLAVQFEGRAHLAAGGVDSQWRSEITMPAIRQSPVREERSAEALAIA